MQSLIDTEEFQQLILDYINTDKVDKWFTTTVFSEKDNADELRSAMIHGMLVAAMLTTQCRHIEINDPINIEEPSINIEETKLEQVVIDGDVIHNLQEAADWLRESGICDCYNLWYEEVGEKGTSSYRECIFVEPTRDHEDLVGVDICSLEEFYDIAIHGYIE